jgi:hypothetical protein
MTRIEGFVCVSKVDGVVWFHHCFGGNTLGLPATPEQMQRFRLHGTYHLDVKIEDMNHERAHGGARVVPA